jgi:hypothetical protein
MLALEREAAATIANAGPSTALRFAQDDNSEKGAEENRQLQGPNAGPSTAVRFAQDDNSEKGAEENRQLQGRNAGPSTAVLTIKL